MTEAPGINDLPLWFAEHLRQQRCPPHIWQLAGATTASDGYRCAKCGARIEVHADEIPSANLEI